MQGGIGDRHTPNKYRCQAGDWRNRARTAHLHFDIQQGSKGLLRRKFMRNRKARRAGDKTQHTLGIKFIDFIDNTIDVIRQARATCTHLFVVAQEISGPLRHNMLRDIDRQA